MLKAIGCFLVITFTHNMENIFGSERQSNLRQRKDVRLAQQVAYSWFAPIASVFVKHLPQSRRMHISPEQVR